MSGTRLVGSTTAIYPRKAPPAKSDESNSLTDCVDLLSGLLSFGSVTDGEKAGHFDGQAVRFTVTSALGKAVPHGLGRRPKGRHVVKQTDGGVLFDVEKLWTDTQAYFKSTRVPCTFTVVLF